MLVEKGKILWFIQEKIDYLNDNVVTDGVHSVPINSQVIDLLVSIRDYVDSLENVYPSVE